jgi:hypothetical protein
MRLRLLLVLDAKDQNFKGLAICKNIAKSGWLGLGKPGKRYMSQTGKPGQSPSGQPRIRLECL